MTFWSVDRTVLYGMVSRMMQRMVYRMMHGVMHRMMYDMVGVVHRMVILRHGKPGNGKQDDPGQ